MTLRPALVALGSNLSSGPVDSAGLVRQAIGALGRIGPTRAARIFATPAVPAGSGPAFVNSCALVVTDLGPESMLRKLHAIERAHGRTRPGRWAPRTLDLDLLALGGLVAPSRAGWARWRRLPPAAQARLAPRRPVLPHPRLQDRAFVLVPLCDIAPDWRHPVTGRTARAMLAALGPGRLDGIRPVGG